ncbi:MULTISPECIES: IS1595 family transposase [Bacillus cereus group]|uniref:IS1595 family transposase n=1 Tax=Bacillus proteolyticus TaxID=2026192 RepID=A0ABV3IK23_9BACI|nr:IS1595 family transposase [Bacillus cereus group sp. N8]MBJ8107023.1 IS1595 family transposase [Bacillus cereus group sp. N8]
MWSDVYEDFSELSKEEQYKLFRTIQQDLFPENSEDISKMVNDIREARFHSGLACVHCGGLAVKRNGKYRLRQRYLCRDCGKSFNEMTGSPMAGTHHPHKWLDYFKMMVEGYTLPKIARELDIHISTAFYWRHKILNAIRSLGNGILKGIVESDETFILESHKGKKNIGFRKPRKRGGVAGKRGISKEQICVVVAYDRDGGILSQMAGKGRITAHELNGVLGSNIDTSALLCTDSATNYKTFAKMKGLQHEAINVRKGTYVRKGIYHIQHVNSYHRRFKEWMNRFQGVATRYLDNYLFWYRFLELHKKMPKKEKVKYMLLQTCRKVNFTTVETFRTV